VALKEVPPQGTLASHAEEAPRLRCYRVVAMIKNAKVLATVRKNWAGVEALRGSLDVSAYAAIGGGGLFPFRLSNAAHNLPFLHASAVLNDVLEQLAKEGYFECEERALGKLLRASEGVLSWKNFALMMALLDRRNALAHRGKVFDRTESWKYVDAIKVELTAWGVL